MTKNLRLNERGEWEEAVPIGWQEEHNRLQRFVFWIFRVKHCSPEERL